ncbi:MAG TPA: phosphatidylglycerol lysyltransferase domain-containing protein, partial [Thermoanaerobaculia bacterium]
MDSMHAAASHPTGGSRRELERARELVLAHGWNSTSYQILNPGIRLWFSAAHEAVVGYVAQAGRLVAAGAPVCAEAALPEVAEELERDARWRGLRVCYFAAESRRAEAHSGSRRHSLVVLGAQPVWAPRSWPAIVARHASLRAQLHRARNKGVAIVEWPTARARQPEIARCLGEWLAARGLPPLRFLVEPHTLDRLTDRRIFAALRHGALVGFLVASPVPRRNGWLVEQIVRGAAAPNGTAELMIDAALGAMAEGGSAYVTLGLAPLSRRGPVPLSDNP